MIGKTLSHYKVIEKIGQGGMGVVYRAEDTNLSRDVAIKVLPEQFTKDPQRLARFEREAKLLASLNHPNIAAIYGLEEADGVRFLALELVEGETLAERVAKGPVPVEEALEVCRQIAEGVEAAHEKGVIHRDLKPANVKVTPEGKVKILDFGLAKAFEGETPIADISQSPTLTEEMTKAGVILGTAAYMSPEQARGKPVDKRSDIFAFGCVLYELLTGRRAFGGETVTDTLAKILEGEPDWEALPQNTPAAIRTLLQRSLTKDPGRRFRDIEYGKIQIEEALNEPAAVSPIEMASAVQPVQQRWGMTVGLVVLALAVGGLVSWLLIQPSSPEQPVNQFAITPLATAPLQNRSQNELAISSDGMHIVYTAMSGSTTQLYLRSLGDVLVTPINGTEGALHPFLSPDGRNLAFFAQGQLKRVPLTGGSAITLCAVVGPGARGSWGSEDTIVFVGASESGSTLRQVSASGGEPEILATPNRDKGEGGYYDPQILPGGKAVLFTNWDGDTTRRIAVLSLETGEQKILLAGASDPHYLPSGQLVYVGTNGTLMAVPFELRSLEIAGDPAPVLQGVRFSIPGNHDYAISDNGTLVYVPGSAEAHRHSLVWVDRQGTETLVTQEKQNFNVPRISPNGEHFTVNILDENSGYRNVWIYDLETESLSRLTFEEENNGMPVWSSDSKTLIFQAGKLGDRGLFRQPVDRSRPQERLTTTSNRQMPHSWSPDGKVVAFTADGKPGRWDIGILPLEGDGKPEFIISTDAGECCAVFSPDGKWLAYVSDETGQDQVYVRPYPEPDVKWLISGEGGGNEPVWSPGGKELFYRSGNRMMVVSIQTQGQTLTAESPGVLFEGSYVSHSTPPGLQYYDITPDGKRFLMMKEEVAAEQGQIHVVLNWFEELKRLVPTE